MLSTNTAISNCLESGKFYLMIGQLITTTNGNPPVITYNQNSANPVQSPQGAQLDMINKVGLVGLGHVISSAEVVAGGTEDAVCLEVIVAHNDWNPRITGNVVDFNMKEQMAIVLVDFVAVTQGHGSSGRISTRAPGSGLPSKAGRNFVKFKPTPEGAVSPIKFCGSNGSPLLSTYIKKGAGDVASTSQEKGKDKAGDNDNSLDSSSSSSKDKGKPQATPPKKAQGRPRKDILKAAAKRMKCA
ncbi:hypothetical protein PCASD_25379 [Puccinia coronata f. sp. avenae]|uniref:Uncharacterized protein n=1 Tax=Puccinia coronata f. sp. avenae TaxID=200324 RepID=A0A2N5TPI0_9BASI|nr:hypothetical protein PCASD_25379 [Puccinia coronata f. sp. avenae]